MPTLQAAPLVVSVLVGLLIGLTTWGFLGSRGRDVTSTWIEDGRRLVGRPPDTGRIRFGCVSGLRLAEMRDPETRRVRLNVPFSWA